MRAMAVCHPSHLYHNTSKKKSLSLDLVACQSYHHLVRYAVWNNKGGVGKSFLSFVIATEWIKSYPEHNVLVVDMCPQANVSEILLGGNGDGSDHLAKLLENRKPLAVILTRE